ncbi:Ca2+:Cation Antiporter [Blattamonas nauphoetae]|uniref:Ca2+:Cation Antiporter n=1 Tax=Blattamonas nauphoetae TaxID=2049346 RepID=A0ABQ9XEK9_9EUKA|nr:Ca2+:Cation Antiporter [Blattamonas nauphoetae]
MMRRRPSRTSHSCSRQISPQSCRTPKSLFHHLPHFIVVIALAGLFLTISLLFSKIKDNHHPLSIHSAKRSIPVSSQSTILTTSSFSVHVRSKPKLSQSTISSNLLSPQQNPLIRSNSSDLTLHSSSDPRSNHNTCNPPKLPSGVDVCAYAKANCQEEAGSSLFPYIYMRYCAFNRAPWLYFMILLILVVILFFVKISTTLMFFVPPLLFVSDVLGLSENMAGITFLAISNAAPDVFTQMAAGAQDSFGMTMGDSLGSSLFNVAGVVSIVVLIRPFKATKELLWKDALSFGLSTLIMLALVLVGKYLWWLCIVFPVIYAVYIFASWVLERFQKRQASKNPQIEDSESQEMNPTGEEGEVSGAEDGALRGEDGGKNYLSGEDGGKNYLSGEDGGKNYLSGEPGVPPEPSPLSINSNESTEMEDMHDLAGEQWESRKSPHPLQAVQEQPILPESKSSQQPSEITASTGPHTNPTKPPATLSMTSFSSFVKSFFPYFFDRYKAWTEWEESGRFGRIVDMCQLPVTLLREMTGPAIFTTSATRVIFNTVVSPPLLVFLMGMWDEQIVVEMNPTDTSTTNLFVFPVWVLVELISAICLCPLLLWLDTKPMKRKRWVQVLFAVLRFGIGVIWMNAFTGELVNIFKTLGFHTNISETTLAATIIAVGDAFQDAAACVDISLKGRPDCALASCYASPFVTFLMGMCLASISYYVSSTTTFFPDPIDLAPTVNMLVMVSVLVFVMVFSIITLAIRKQKMERWFAFTLLLFYLIFFVYTYLDEFGVFRRRVKV